MAGAVVYGSNRLALRLVGRTVTEVDERTLQDGWILLHLDDGSSLHISAEYGASLDLTFWEATT